MITYNTYNKFTWVTAIAGVLFYIFIRKERTEYSLENITIDVPCQRMFERLSNIHFIKKMNSRISRADLLFEIDDEEKTTARFLFYENVPYIGEISYENTLISHAHNYTILHKADVWFSYMKFAMQWELEEVSDKQCRGKQTQITLVPMVFKSFVERQVLDGRADSIDKMKTLLEEE